jgi:serine/threonine protein kinase
VNAPDAPDAAAVPAAPRRSTSIGDAALAHLRAVIDEPDVAGTRYELLEPVGRGGMGVVWRARDRQLERDVALKVVATPDAESAKLLASWLEREAKVLARLEHPGIVPVHDVGLLADGRVYYAMKLVRGARLDALVKSGLPIPERFRIFARIAEAVAFAHSRHVLHRDLKPANVMVGEFGEVLVLDWGLAHAQPGQRVGTPGFMAPESERGEAADERADVYSLGKLLEALAIPGRPMKAIVGKATAPRAADRYAGAAELAADVEAFQRGAPVSALPESVLVKLERIYRSCRVAIWIVAIYVLVRVALELARRWWFARGG